jgi:hypothetical protein
MIEITLSSVKTFFDQSTILTPAEKAQLRLLKGFGSYCRKVQRNSMKRGTRNQRSKPGGAPLRRDPKVDIKNTSFFFVDGAAKDVTIGMVLLKSISKHRAFGSVPMPGQLEQGGTMQKGRRAVQFEPRPSAHLAFNKAIKEKLDGLIAGGIMREV